VQKQFNFIFFIGDNSFTDLSQLYDAGMMGEFLSKDERYSKRKTFAVRFGYVGTEYGGYQSQKNLTYPAIAVEDDIRRILGMIPFIPPYHSCNKIEAYRFFLFQAKCVVVLLQRMVLDALIRACQHSLK
jgi:hypothetical protein